MKFVDEVQFKISSGKGGPGCVSFRREAKVPRGGPDGGDGGRGGNVVIKVNSQLHSLLDLKFKKVYRAENGRQGEGSHSSGLDGKDLILHVPPGTIIKDATTGSLIVDMDEKSEHQLLKGGLGGKGNSYYKTSVNQAPSYAQKGLPGEEIEVALELKLIADVGFIGFPSAGKSTLISRVSAARPKVADYPFTTLVPNLGVVKYSEEKSFVVADIPGLIKGAHTGQGLGTQFLRHIERTKLFVHLIDVNEMTTRDPRQDYEDINFELSQHDVQNQNKVGYIPLSTRYQIVVLNKVDTISEERLTELKQNFKEMGVDVMAISAVTGAGVQELIYKMGDIVFENNE